MDRPKVPVMAVARRRTPLALRLGRARRRALTRRALLGRQVGAASAAIVEAWTSAPEPAVAGGPSLVEPAAILPSEAPPLVVGPLPRGDVPPADVVGAPAGRLRRCTFRRLDLVEPAMRGERATYAVMCLYASTAEPAPLGDLTSAAVVCGVCTNTGIFRPDEA
jgi:hypothetical protein